MINLLGSVLCSIDMMQRATKFSIFTLMNFECVQKRPERLNIDTLYDQEVI